MIFEARNLTKSFGEKTVLKEVGFKAQSGRALGLLGRNGAGKTTTIRIVMGVFPPDSGEVLMDGKPIERGRLNIGYLPEERGLYPKKPILEQLIYLAQLRGMSAKEAKEAAVRWAKRLGMEEHLNKKLDTLSKGNQQKIQLAATLLTNPDFVILDEPFSGLDPVNAMLLKDIVKELIAQGKIVLFSSHQMSYVEEFCNDIAILNQGKIVLSGDIREIKRSYDRSRLIIVSSQKEKIAAYCKQSLSNLVKSCEDYEGDIRLTMNKEGSKQEVLSALIGQGFDLDGVHVYEPSLNDIFVQYTEGAI